jgi:hypothetical protein
MLQCILIFLFCLLLNYGYCSELVGTYGMIENDIEYVYQLPKEGTTGEAIKGVVFFAHGCAHSVLDWWPEDPQSCPKCKGLPIETSLVQEALSRRYVALAASSSNKVHHCWTEEDVPRMITLFKYFYQNILRDTNMKIPLHLLGASSGGSFVGLLGQTTDVVPRVKSICVQISAMRFLTSNPSLPALFVAMERDEFTIKRVEKNMSKLKSSSRFLKVPEQPIEKNYFSEHTRGSISASESEEIFNAFKEHGVIDNQTHRLIEDPRRSNWRTVRNCLTQ